MRRKLSVAGPRRTKIRFCFALERSKDSMSQAPSEAVCPMSAESSSPTQSSGCTSVRGVGLAVNRERVLVKCQVAVDV